MRGSLKRDRVAVCVSRLSAVLVACAATLGLAFAQEVKIRPHADVPAAEESTPAGAPARTSSPRGLLELFGVADWLDRAADGADFPPEGDELLWRSLYAVRRLPLVEIDRCQRQEPLHDLRAAPAKFRGEIIALTGTLSGLTHCDPSVKARDDFNLAGYDRCEIEVGPERQRAIVYALRLPKKWQAESPLSQRVGVKGMFVRLASEEDHSAPILVARRMAWYPQTPLGDLGMDVGLFDDVSTSHGLSASDRECFYQLLAAAGRAGTRQLLRAVPKDGRDAKVTPLFNEPRKQQGRLVELTGTARRAVLVRVEDRDIIERLGIDHYYELQVFTSDSQDNPLTFCVRELPRGFPDGDRIIETVRIAGFFFKKWGFRSSEEAEPQAQAKPGAIRRQLAPLLVGREPVWVRPVPADQRFANGVALVLFVVLTAVLWLVVAILSRGDAKFHRQVSHRLSPPPTEHLAAALFMPEGNSAEDDDPPKSATPDETGMESLPAATDESGTSSEAAALFDVAVREISKEPFAEQYRARQESRGFSGVELLVLVGAVVASRLLVWCLRQAGL